MARLATGSPKLDPSKINRGKTLSKPFPSPFGFKHLAAAKINLGELTSTKKASYDQGVIGRDL